MDNPTRPSPWRIHATRTLRRRPWCRHRPRGRRHRRFRPRLRRRGGRLRHERDYTGVADPNSTLTVSGTGCLDPSGNPTSLLWAIGDAGSAEPAGPAEAAGPTESSEAADASNSSSSSNDSDASTSTSPSTSASASASTATSASGSSGTGEVQEDGSWTATIDLARAVPAAGLKDQQRTGLSFVCADYNNNSLKTLSLSLQLDSSKLSGEYKLINQADGTQTIALDVKGFAPGEEVTFRAALENVYNSEAGPPRATTPPWPHSPPTRRRRQPDLHAFRRSARRPLQGRRFRRLLR